MSKSFLIITSNAFFHLVRSGRLSFVMDNMKKNGHAVYVYGEPFSLFGATFDEDPQSQDILKYYYQIRFIRSSISTDSVSQIKKFINNTNPDNILIVVNSLYEFDYFNSEFGNDELIPYTSPLLATHSIEDILTMTEERYGT